ncbi:serine/threonine-protein kinase [Kitasatospora sp. NPDC101155]|uniref:serine/threonine-protein kinase n=1 Tax=Kitasatospora sp. NPDC101155 TaxID=3364097 RepID=UPI00382B0321
MEQLGAGGMGTVWRARDLTLERQVALKEMRSVGSAEPDRVDRTRERVLREARALARVNHPNAVTVYEVLDDRPYPWLVMELVDGPSLSAVLGHGPLDPAQAARIGLDVLAALRAAHASGILHRDVKPGNVLIRPDGTAVLTDFGIAALQGAQTLTATGDLVGSPEYVAPERIRGGAVGPASDLWSLGMLLYVCVEGANPLRRDSVWETLMAACDQPLPTPPHAGPLAPVIDALLAKDPEQRPRAAELTPLLATAATDRATAEAAADPATPTVRLDRRHIGAPTLLAPNPLVADPAPVAEAGSRRPTTRRRRRLPVLLAAVVGAAVLGAAATAAFTLPGLHGGSSVTGSAQPPAPSDSPAPVPGTWIAQLAEIPHSAGTDERDRQLEAIEQQVPRAVLEDSDAFASLPPGHWIVRAPETFEDGYAALDFCARYGSDGCSGRYLSQDPADRSYVCQGSPAPDPATCRRPGDPVHAPTADDSSAASSPTAAQ